jgi:DNA-binding MurR/RpiR family transcriptional regulator
MPIASSKINCLNFSFRSLLNAKRYQQQEAFEAVRGADLLLYVSSGRSKHSFETGAGEIARNTFKTVVSFDDVGLSGDTLDIAAPKYEKIYDNPLSIYISATGETPETVEPLQQMASYLEHNKGSNWTSLLLTQSPNSTAGKAIGEMGDKGMLLEFKGSENFHSKNYPYYGIQRDRFEYANLWFWQALGQTLIEAETDEKIPEFIEQRLPQTGEQIDAWMETEEFEKCVKNHLRHSEAFIAGRRGGMTVGKFSTKRYGQVKQALGDGGFFFGGDNTPNPRMGDVVHLISKSGGKRNFYSDAATEKPYILDIAEKSKKVGAIVYSYVGTRDSPLEKLSDFMVVFDSNEPTKYSDVYCRIATFQGVIPLVVAQRADLRPEELRKKHGF